MQDNMSSIIIIRPTITNKCKNGSEMAWGESLEGGVIYFAS